MSILNSPIDRMAFWDSLKASGQPVMMLTLASIVLGTVFLNSVVSKEEIRGKVIRLAPVVNYKTDAQIAIFIELEDHRNVRVVLPSLINLPKTGYKVNVVGYIRRFFGESFGLKL